MKTLNPTGKLIAPRSLRILAASAIAASACGESGSVNEWTVVRDTLPSGVERVTNTPPPRIDPTWTLVEEIRVGTLEADRPESFGQLKGMVRLDDGGFAVLESQAQEIRVFAADGSHLVTHGRRGEGPGEFIDANGLMLGPSGRIWVPDSRSNRMSVLDPQDGFVESYHFVSRWRSLVWMGAMAADGRILKPSILSLDPPDHTRLRRLVNRAFTPRQIAKMEAYIRATAHELLDRVEGTDEFDLMKALAVPLPTLVIARMIGVHEGDLEQFKVWSDRFARVLEPSLTEQEQELVLQTDREFGDYFTGIIEQRRREPRDDLVSRLVEAEEEGDKLNAEETRVMLRLLLVAGSETGIHHCLGAPLARLEGRIAGGLPLLHGSDPCADHVGHAQFVG